MSSLTDLPGKHLKSILNHIYVHRVNAGLLGMTSQTRQCQQQMARVPGPHKEQTERTVLMTVISNELTWW